MTIAFYETERPESERVDFQHKVQSLEIPLHQSVNEVLANIPDVLFYHGGDFASLLNNGQLRPGLENIWLIEFGGNDSRRGGGQLVNADPQNQWIGYIKYSDLSDRLEKVIEEISGLTEITKMALEDIIFAIDPELERLLEPFAKAGPFANEPELQQAKAVLIAYVNSLGADA